MGKHSTYEVHLSLPRDTHTRLLAEARQRGLTPNQFARYLLGHALEGVIPHPELPFPADELAQVHPIADAAELDAVLEFMLGDGPHPDWLKPRH